MPRTYTKNKRAENEAETRQRITEAALALHSEVGPNRTTISMIADRAGVQRHTVYAHFPDDRSIMMACSGLHAERAPIPSPDGWEAINDPATRLSKALTEIYAWFARNDVLMAAVLRDAEENPVLAEVSSLRFGTGLRAIRQSLDPGLGAKGRAALALALSFYSWRTLAREGGLKPDAIVALMTRTVLDADEGK